MSDVKPLDDLLQELDNLSDGEEEPAATTAGPLHASKINYRDYPVLVVDDEEENILAFQLNFRHDFEIDSAMSGPEALEVLSQREFSVVVTDQRMPGMTGVELLERTVARYPHLIRIIVTGYTDNQSLIDAINMGRIYKYITKPWSQDEMGVTIKRAIEAYALGRENDRLLAELQKKNLELERIVEERTRKLRDANTKLHQLAITDGLTGLFNHRYFQEKWREEIKRSERFREPTTLLLLDVDWFKNYNDCQGHPRGDVVLRDLASLLERNFREVDVVARYGGEEFAVILPRTTKDAGHQLADRIRAIVEEAPFPHQEVQPGGSITCSFGLATFPDDGATAATVLEHADQALYAAKSEGRNCVVAFEPGLPMPVPDSPLVTSDELAAPSFDEPSSGTLHDLPSTAIDVLDMESKDGE